MFNCCGPREQWEINQNIVVYDPNFSSFRHIEGGPGTIFLLEKVLEMKRQTKGIGMYMPVEFLW